MAVTTVLFLFASLHISWAVKVGQACSGRGQCEENAACTSPTVGGTCDCVNGFFQQGDKCVPQSQVCSSDNRRSFRAGVPDLTLTCKDLAAGDTVVWWYGPNSDPVEIGSCPPLPAKCTTPSSSVIQLFRPSNVSSQLKFSGPLKMPSSGEVVLCKVNAAQKALYYLDVFEEGSVTNRANFTLKNGKNWVAEGHSVAANITSSQGCYSCQWFQENKVTKEKLKIPTQVKREISPGSKVSRMTCSFQLTHLPLVDGAYSYRVRLTYSQKTYPVRNQQIAHPPTPVHDCPALVAEGSSFTCVCSRAQCEKGIPRRVFTWNTSNDNRLTVTEVRREQHGTVFTCSEQSGVAVNYTLRVAYGPSGAHIATAVGRHDSALLVLTCVAVDANPTPTFTWRRPHTDEVLAQGQILEVNVDDLEENGGVECEAKNSENKVKVAKASMTLDMLQTHLNYTTMLAERSVTDEKDRQLVGVAIGVGVVLSLLVMTLLIVIIVLYARGRKLPFTGSKTSKVKSTRNTVELLDITESSHQDSGEDTEAETKRAEDSVNQETDAIGERGFPEGASNYDALDSRKVDQSSPYDDLRAPLYGNVQVHSDTGPVYTNREDILESPIYANTQPGDGATT